jgi:hypothetical protein
MNSINNEKKNMKVNTKMFGNSKRLTLTYIVLITWLGLAVFAIIKDADFYGLAVYFASGLPLILGYLWAESTKPSIKDASEILKNIGNPRQRRNKDQSNFYGGNFYGQDNNGDFYNDSNNNEYENNYGQNQQNSSYQQIETGEISIYSEDASTELKINQNQFETLKNIGYVNSIGGKNIFKMSLLEQIKSLINDNGQQPVI